MTFLSPHRVSSPSAQVRQARRPFRWWHDHIIDWLLANPGATMEECGLFFGRSGGTMAAIVNSDLFRARYAQRKASHNRQLSEFLVERTAGVAMKALDLVAERLTENPAGIPTADAASIASSMLERLGYGGPTNAPVSVTVNQQAISSEVLASARAEMRRIEHRPVEATRALVPAWETPGNE